jgi:hypothetical protein
MTHTPAPWHLWSSKDGGFTISAGYQDEAVICQRSDWDHRATESVDNGRLIAAAPDMLAALRLLQGFAWAADDSEHGKEIKRRAEAAIAKAEGRS